MQHFATAAVKILLRTLVFSVTVSLTRRLRFGDSRDGFWRLRDAIIFSDRF